jgi:hypothetical protein
MARFLALVTFALMATAALAERQTVVFAIQGMT